MAKRRAQAEGCGFLIWAALIFFGVIVGVVLTAAVYVPPIILIGGLLYFEIRKRRTPQEACLSPDEVTELSNTEAELRAVRVRLRKLCQKGSHLKINLDGSYHRGSKLGVELNEKIDELLPREEELETQAHDIRQRPLHILQEWIHVSSLQRAFCVTAFAYWAVALVLYLLDPRQIEAFSRFVGQHVLVHISSMRQNFYGIALASTLAATMLLLLAYESSRLWIEHSTKATRQRVLKFAAEEDDNPVEEEDEGPDRERADEDGVGEDPNASRHGENKSTGAKGARPEERWYETLGVSPTASSEEIHAAWRERIKKSHPDRVAGLDADFQVLAEEKAKRLNAAYEEGLRVAGR